MKNSTGKRFVNETVEMSLMNCYLRSAEDAGHYCQIFDSTYMEDAADWAGKLVDPEALKVYMPEEDVEREGVFEGQINTYKADTLEELAEKLEIADVDAFVETVERYNELQPPARTRISASPRSTWCRSTPRPTTASIAMCA